MSKPAINMGETSIDLSKLWFITNPVFRKLHAHTERIIVCMGGAGSGKSAGVAQMLAVTAMIEPGHHIVAFRKVATTMRTSIFEEFKQALIRLNVLNLWRSNLTEMTWTFVPNGSVFRCRGLDDAEKMKSIYGMTRAWVEEATEISPKDLKQINLRLRPRNVYVKQIILTFNPINAGHWLKKRFFDIAPKGRWRIILTTFRDNIFLDKEYIQEILAYNDPESPDYDPYMWEVYGMGHWGIVGNLIYMPFLTIPWSSRFIKNRDDYGLVAQYRNMNDDEKYNPPETIYGLDFGFNAPTALVQMDIDERDVYVSELFYVRELTTPSIIKRMKKLRIPYSNTPKNLVSFLGLPIIYADSASPGEIEELRVAGFNVLPADKHAGSIGAGIKLIKSLKIHTKDDNVSLNGEQASYHWKEDRDGNKLDVPVDDNNHALDAMRYALYTHMRERIAEETGTDVEELQEEDFFPEDDIGNFFSQMNNGELIEF